MRQLKITYTLTNRDSTSVEKYFNEVSKEGLLSADEEVELAKRIRQGDEQALHKLVRANLRFVVSVAKQYQYGKLPLSDLINEGNLGLMKAAKMYDETRGFKFISYAVWWIRQSIMQSLAEHSRLVRIPYNKTNDLMKINHATSAIEQKVEREPTPEELADFMGVPVDSVKNAQSAAIKQTSLDAPFDQEEGNSLLDVMDDPEAEFADTMLVTKGSLNVELKRLMSRLTEREQHVIKQFFGIDCDFNYTLEDIAANLGLTMERVRQIKEGALKKLRNRSALSLLQSYI